MVHSMMQGRHVFRRLSLIRVRFAFFSISLLALAFFDSNDQDVIVFSMHEHGYQKQCTDDPTGTYIAPVPYFLDGYLKDIAQEMEDQGYEYQAPDVAQYIECTPFVIENVQYYFQVGCADGTSQALAVNIYEDNACTTRSVVDGFDDSNIDVSSIQVRTNAAGETLSGGLSVSLLITIWYKQQ